MHAAIHRPRLTDLKLWPFVLHHAVRLWSILPDRCTKLSPLELISGLHIPNYTHLQCLYFSGFPTFVFDPNFRMELNFLNGFQDLIWVVSWDILIPIHPLLVSFSIWKLAWSPHNSTLTRFHLQFLNHSGIILHHWATKGRIMNYLKLVILGLIVKHPLRVRKQ